MAQQNKVQGKKIPQTENILNTLSNLNVYLDMDGGAIEENSEFTTRLNALAEKFCQIYEKEKDKMIYKLLKKYYLAAVCKCIKTTNAQKLKKVKDRTKQLTAKGIQGVTLAGSSAVDLASKASSGAVGLASTASAGAVTLGSKGLSGAVTLGSKGLSGAVDLGSKVGGMISSKVRSLTKSQKCDVMNNKILLAVLQGKSLDDIKSSLNVNNQVIEQALQTKSELGIEKYDKFFAKNFSLIVDDQTKGFQMTQR